MTYKRPLRWLELIDDLTSVEFLLTVNYAGRPYYFSTRPRVLTDERGEPIQYEGGLQAQWTDALDLFNESPTLLSIPLSLYFSDDVAELISKGFDLWRATGELSLWVDGRPYEDRIVLIDGNVNDPSYGAKGEPVKFSLEANGFEDTALTHTPFDRVLPSTWPNADEAAALRYYPIVYGAPGIYAGGTAPGSPALAVDVDIGAATVRFLVAGHEVVATSATFINVSKNPAVSLLISLITEEDARGTVVTTTVAVPIGAGFWDLGDEVYVVWDNGGAMYNDRRDGVRSGAGDLISYFLRRSTLRIDSGTWAAIYPELNIGYRFAGYVDEPCSPFEYIRDNFLPLLPISITATGEGMAGVLWRRDAEKSDAVGTIETGGGVARADFVQYERQKIYNNMRLDYALDASNNDPQKNAGVLGDPSIVDTVLFTADAGQFATEYSRASFYRYGNRAMSFDTAVVWEDATATNVLQWKHRAAAFPYRVIPYDVPIRMGFLRRGDLVLLTDEEIHLSGYLCFVRDIQWTNGKPRIFLVLIDDPPREKRVE